MPQNSQGFSFKRPGLRAQGDTLRKKLAVFPSPSGKRGEPSWPGVLHVGEHHLCDEEGGDFIVQSCFLQGSLQLRQLW